jgi:hypothetical protein
MRNIDEQVEFNSGNKGYLFAAKFYQTDQMKLMPLAALSNCGAMLLHSTSTTNEANSHLDGLIRELGVPVLVINNDVQFHQIRDLAMGSLRICADEFNREGWISTDVPSAANKPEKKRFSLWPF